MKLLLQRVPLVLLGPFLMPGRTESVQGAGAGFRDQERFPLPSRGPDPGVQFLQVVPDRPVALRRDWKAAGPAACFRGPWSRHPSPAPFLPRHPSLNSFLSHVPSPTLSRGTYLIANQLIPPFRPLKMPRADCCLILCFKELTATQKTHIFFHLSSKTEKLSFVFDKTMVLMPHSRIFGKNA